MDDGFSGGNFNRPDFIKMIEDIEQGHIDIVLTKDLSRLGRNYIQVGYYTEEYFPDHNVRFIAINDNYDSTKDDNDFTPFKNIINQWYLKDISKKVKSSLLNKMKKGILPSTKINTLYGYKCSENCQREIDEQTAKNVKLIYQLFLDGNSIYKIIKHLYENKIETPEFLNYLRYGHKGHKWINATEKQKYTWNEATIKRILNNEEYTGTLILHKTKTINYKTHKKALTEKQEQYRFENKFEPIIDKKTFNKVLDLKNKKVKVYKQSYENKLARLIFCDNCGKELSFIHYNEQYKYGKKRYDSYYCRCTTCNKKAYTPASIIYQILEEDINNVINACLEKEDKLKEYALTYHKQKNEQIDKINENIKELNIRNNSVTNIIKQLYENSAKGIIPLETFNTLINSYSQEIKTIQENLSILNSQIDLLNKIDHNKELDNTITYFKSLTTIEPTKKLIQNLIDKITIAKDKKETKINIEYKNIPTLIKDFINENK